VRCACRSHEAVGAPRRGLREYRRMALQAAREWRHLTRFRCGRLVPARPRPPGPSCARQPRHAARLRMPRMPAARRYRDRPTLNIQRSLNAAQEVISLRCAAEVVASPRYEYATANQRPRVASNAAAQRPKPVPSRRCRGRAFRLQNTRRTARRRVRTGVISRWRSYPQRHAAFASSRLEGGDAPTSSPPSPTRRFRCMPQRVAVEVLADRIRLPLFCPRGHAPY